MRIGWCKLHGVDRPACTRHERFLMQWRAWFRFQGPRQLISGSSTPNFGVLSSINLLRWWSACNLDCKRQLDYARRIAISFCKMKMDWKIAKIYCYKLIFWVNSCIVLMKEVAACILGRIGTFVLSDQLHNMLMAMVTATSFVMIVVRLERIVVPFDPFWVVEECINSFLSLLWLFLDPKQFWKHHRCWYS